MSFLHTGLGGPSTQSQVDWAHVAIMAKQELVVEAAELRRIQVVCSSRRCSTIITYQIETLRGEFHRSCQACKAMYPNSLVAAIEHFVQFVENAQKATPAVISLQLER